MVLPGVAPEVARRAVAGFLARAEAPVERLTDKGVRRLDARAALIEMTVLDDVVLDTTALERAVLDKAVLDKAVLDMAGAGGTVAAGPDGGSRAAETGFDGCAILRMVVLHTAPAVRPEDIVTALREQDGIVPSSPPMITRLAQGQRAQLAGQAPLAGDGVS